MPSKPKTMPKLMPDSLLPVGSRVGAADQRRRVATGDRVATTADEVALTVCLY